MNSGKCNETVGPNISIKPPNTFPSCNLKPAQLKSQIGKTPIFKQPYDDGLLIQEEETYERNF
jgi:hypothetical protein